MFNNHMLLKLKNVNLCHLRTLSYTKVIFLVNYNEIISIGFLFSFIMNGKVLYLPRSPKCKVPIESSRPRKCRNEQEKD